MHTLFTAQTSQLLTRKQVPVCLQLFLKVVPQSTPSCMQKPPAKTIPLQS